MIPIYVHEMNIHDTFLHIVAPKSNEWLKGSIDLAPHASSLYYK